MTHKLLEGFKKFHREEYGEGELMSQLVRDGQKPEFFIISCIDSRSNPGTIFRPDPGTFFAHKAMGAIVRPYKKGTALAAALQFALTYNDVKDIIILGHTGCGAVRALVEKVQDEEISSFVDVAQAGLEKARHLCGPACSHDQLLRHAEEQIVLQSMENLKHYPSVAKALRETRAVIRAWLFDMETGNLLEYKNNKFEPITDH